MKYKTTKAIATKQLDSLWAAIGWKHRGKKWNKIISESSFVVSAWDNSRLVGLGRVLEDGIMCMFYDIGVHPKYQSKGIGTKIMKILINKIKNKKYASIGLFPWEQNPLNIQFYKKFGFKIVEGMELEKYMKRE